jgi:hypothetical protein
MKKLLYTFLAITLIFSACEEEVVAPSTNNNNNNNSALAIGDTHQGGIIFYLDGNGGGLIASTTDQSTDAEWGCFGTIITGADGMAIGTGSQNTIDIVNANCPPEFIGDLIAANICTNLTLGGYSDWFLPSKEELNEMFLNKAAIGDFASNGYWNSTEAGNFSAWVQYFDDGYQSENVSRDNNYYVRAVRAF